MNLIAQHPYIKVEKKVEGLSQVVIEIDRVIYLYQDKVVTQHREFPIQIVRDFSFREIANEGGMLYLHSTRGVFAYTVKTSPEAFISAYKSHFK
ncbi:hypothetical protein [Kurthia sibirica]|uniref:Uncharacterized protein n=1 Tax=Kurthia sibirica TaxID=202750 RepID=A0A2U3ANM4_9BACL|nr:hypothetical protein [Kurthia sibirica]PWI26121.1 hypothetical protein DEX24_04130 [Kurthia sibirica]GEK33378.1 hypothetical protein KSI01_09110 [Kurthia sibirica]